MVLKFQVLVRRGLSIVASPEPANMGGRPEAGDSTWPSVSRHSYQDYHCPEASESVESVQVCCVAVASPARWPFALLR